MPATCKLPKFAYPLALILVEETPVSIVLPEIVRKEPEIPANVEVAELAVKAPLKIEAPLTLKLPAFTNPLALTFVLETPWRIEAPELAIKPVETPPLVEVPVVLSEPKVLAPLTCKLPAFTKPLAVTFVDETLAIVEVDAFIPELTTSWPPIVALPVMPAYEPEIPASVEVPVIARLPPCTAPLESRYEAETPAKVEVAELAVSEPDRIVAPAMLKLAPFINPEALTLVELTPCNIELPETLMKVCEVPARVEVPVTANAPPLCKLPEVLMYEAETPAKVEVPVIVEVAAEIPEVAVTCPPIVALPLSDKLAAWTAPDDSK